MTDVIIDLIQGILSVFTSIGSSMQVMSLEGFSPQLLGIVTGFANNVFKPIGYTVLSCFALLEFVAIMQRLDSVHGMTGVEIPIKIMIKICLCKLCIDYSPQIIMAFSEITNTLSQGIANGSVNIAGDAEVFRSAIEDMDVLAQIGIMVQLIVVWLIASLSSIVVTVILLGRMFELYVLVAVSPLPVSTFCSDDLKSTGLNYLKYTFSVLLQGTLIIIVVYLFSNYMSGSGAIVTTGDLMTVCWSFLTYALVMVLCIFKSSSWAKSICNVM